MAKKQHRRVAQPTAATLHRPNIPSPRLAAVALVSCCEQQHWQRLLYHQRAAACCLCVSFIAACCWRLGARVEAAAAEQADTLHKHTAVRTSINACAQSMRAKQRPHWLLESQTLATIMQPHASGHHHSFLMCAGEDIVQQTADLILVDLMVPPSRFPLVMLATSCRPVRC
jgi:hypothetical protein